MATWVEGVPSANDPNNVAALCELVEREVLIRPETPNKKTEHGARFFYLARPEGLTHERLSVRSPLRGAYAPLRRPISLCEIVEPPTP